LVSLSDRTSQPLCRDFNGLAGPFVPHRGILRRVHSFTAGRGNNLPDNGFIHVTIVAFLDPLSLAVRACCNEYSKAC
jgi:hypothetical protein